MSGNIPRFVVCVSNADDAASLELHKIYRLMAYGEPKAYGDVQVVDESREHHLCPASSASSRLDFLVRQSSRWSGRPKHTWTLKHGGTPATSGSRLLASARTEFSCRTPLNAPTGGMPWNFEDLDS